MAAAHTLAAINPALTFGYVSGGGTDSSEKGRSRWTRVKGRTKNAVIAAFHNGYALRPGFVQPSHDSHRHRSRRRSRSAGGDRAPPVGGPTGHRDGHGRFRDDRRLRCGRTDEPPTVGADCRRALVPSLGRDPGIRGGSGRRRVRTYDRENGTALVETLTALLDSLGNVLGASASLDVHPNTFRYRLRRAAEIAGTDLNDPGKRFAAMLELRVMRADSP